MPHARCFRGASSAERCACGSWEGRPGETGSRLPDFGSYDSLFPCKNTPVAFVTKVPPPRRALASHGTGCCASPHPRFFRGVVKEHSPALCPTATRRQRCSKGCPGGSVVDAYTFTARRSYMTSVPAWAWLHVLRPQVGGRWGYMGSVLIRLESSQQGQGRPSCADAYQPARQQH